VLTAEENEQSKELLNRIVAMLTKLCMVQSKKQIV